MNIRLNKVSNDPCPPEPLPPLCFLHLLSPLRPLNDILLDHKQKEQDDEITTSGCHLNDGCSENPVVEVQQ